MSYAHAEPLVGSGNGPSVGDFLRQTAAVTEAEVRKLRHDPAELLTRAVQPTLWLLVFGGVFSRVRGIPTGGIPYRDFMTPGIWERDLGILQKFLVSPAPRMALVLGKALSAGVRGLSQAVIVYVLAVLVGIHLVFAPIAIAGVLLSVVLGSAIFAMISLIVACLVKTRERVMGIGQILTMPLFFASNAVYPLDLMPGWLRVVSTVNPLTYQVDALRLLMIRGGTTVFGLTLDYGVQVGTLIVLVILGAKLYPRIVN